MVSYLGYQSFLKEEPSGVGSLVPYLVVLLAAANLFIQDGCLWKWMPQQSKSLMLGTSVTLHLVQSFFFFLPFSPDTRTLGLCTDAPGSSLYPV